MIQTFYNFQLHHISLVFSAGSELFLVLERATPHSGFLVISAARLAPRLSPRS